MALLMAFALVAALSPQPPRPPPTDWLNKPQPEDLVGAYPERALRAGVRGVVYLQCRVTSKGATRRCSVLYEDPKGWGFADATLSQASKFKMRPPTRINPSVIIPVTWTPEDERLQPFFAARFSRPLLWREKPTGAQVQAAYPAHAREAQLKGVAGLACTIDSVGALSDCRVAFEQPKAMGFGGAALSLTRSFKAQTVTSQGVRTEGALAEVVVPFNPAPPASEASDRRR